MNTHTAYQERPTLTEILWDVLDLSAGSVVALLPLFLLAVPGLVFLAALVAPLVVAGVAVGFTAAFVAALLAPPYLLVRAVRRRRR